MNKKQKSPNKLIPLLPQLHHHLLQSSIISFNLQPFFPTFNLRPPVLHHHILRRRGTKMMAKNFPKAATVAYAWVGDTMVVTTGVGSKGPIELGDGLDVWIRRWLNQEVLLHPYPLPHPLSDLLIISGGKEKRVGGGVSGGFLRVEEWKEGDWWLMTALRERGGGGRWCDGDEEKWDGMRWW